MKTINPLIPKGNLYTIVSYNITPESKINITIIKENNDHQLKNLLIAKQILLDSTLGNV